MSAMGHISGMDYSQTLLVYAAIDKYAVPGNAICFINAFVESLDLAAVGWKPRRIANIPVH